MKGTGMLMGDDGDLMVRPKRDEQGMFVSGFVVGHILYQNQFILLKAHKGELKEFPVLGIGLADMVHDHDVAGWSSEIRRQLEKDGMKVKRVVFGPHMNLEIDAGYESE